MHTPTQSVRPPAVAGSFYPRQVRALAEDIEAMLASASTGSQLRPKALIVPHAGYVYSGEIAASAYRLLRQARPQPNKVVLLGPSHHVAFHGLRLPGVDALRTPLGEVMVDELLAQKARAFPFVVDDPQAHEPEHSLEVQLPFLQRVLESFTVLPLVVGRASPGEVAQVLDAVWGGEETVIVVSSDLSHYLPSKQARAIDQVTAQLILSLDEAGVASDQACGAAPVNGLLLAARQHGLKANLLDLRNSGDTAGDDRRVVGYGAFAFASPERV